MFPTTAWHVMYEDMFTNKIQVGRQEAFKSTRTEYRYAEICGTQKRFICVALYQVI